ncbi:hypothetical protein GCM10023178_06430 [Actinomadura luteofluorescens]
MPFCGSGRRHESHCAAPGLESTASQYGHMNAVLSGVGGRCWPWLRPLALAQPRDPHVRAPDLEGAGALQVLALQQDGPADLLRQHPGGDQRRRDGHPAQQLPGGADVVDTDRGQTDVTLARSRGDDPPHPPVRFAHVFILARRTYPALQ